MPGAAGKTQPVVRQALTKAAFVVGLKTQSL